MSDLGLRAGAVIFAIWFLVIGQCAATAAEVKGTQPPAGLAQQEKEACTANLKAIYLAIEAYQADRKDLPEWLSDLVPRYLRDPNLLVCPVCRRTGQVESAPLADPKLPSSYLFEFCPVRLGQSAPKAANRTRREWKRRQMGLLGSAVPLVRCRHHDPVLNLAFDGRIYESPPFWEWNFTNRISAESLTAARLFAQDSDSAENASQKTPPRQFPPRPASAPAQLLDLTPFYNALLSDSWHQGQQGQGNDLSELPVGIERLAGVDFDIRGIVQLASKQQSSAAFPSEVKGIRVGQKCRRIYFLHAAGFGKMTDEGKQIGTYIIHYGSDQMRCEIPIIYGQSVRDWHVQAQEAEPAKDLKVAWTGQNALSRRSNHSIRLFLTSWSNRVPDLEIESIDFTSSMLAPAPFLIAVTIE